MIDEISDLIAQGEGANEHLDHLISSADPKNLADTVINIMNNLPEAPYSDRVSDLPDLPKGDDVAEQEPLFRVPQRDKGFDLVKKIFMINPMARPYDLPAPKRVLKLEDYEDKQAILCTEIAIDYAKNLSIVNERPIRCNSLFEHQTPLYYHVNFVATDSVSKNDTLFFAEIKGQDGPEEATCCIKLSDGGVADNCDFCSGIFHPKSVNFFGKKTVFG